MQLVLLARGTEPGIRKKEDGMKSTAGTKRRGGAALEPCALARGRGVGVLLMMCLVIVGSLVVGACDETQTTENETQIVGVVSVEASFQGGDIFGGENADLGQVQEVSGATIRLADGSEVQAEVDLAESDIPKLFDSSLRWRAEKRETGWVITGAE